MEGWTKKDSVYLQITVYGYYRGKNVPETNHKTSIVMFAVSLVILKLFVNTGFPVATIVLGWATLQVYVTTVHLGVMDAETWDTSVSIVRKFRNIRRIIMIAMREV